MADRPRGRKARSAHRAPPLALTSRPRRSAGGPGLRRCRAAISAGPGVSSYWCGTRFFGGPGVHPCDGRCPCWPAPVVGSDAGAGRPVVGRALRPGDAEDVEPVVAEPVHQRFDNRPASRCCTAPSASGGPPTPGTSNRTTSIRGSTRSTNGWSRVRLGSAAVVEHRRGAGAVPCRTATHRSWPSTLTGTILVTCRRRRHREPPPAPRNGWTRAPWAPDAARQCARRPTGPGRSTSCPGGRRPP
jgi:hypothetical protein